MIATPGELLYPKVCEICNGDFPEEKGGSSPLTDLEVDTLCLTVLDIETKTRWMNGSHLRCICKTHRESKSINRDRLRRVERSADGKGRIKSLSLAAIYKISKFWGANGSDVNEEDAPPSALRLAMEALDAEQEGSTFHALLKERMKIDPVKDEDRYADLRECFLAAIRENAGRFKIMFEYIKEQEVRFSAPLLDKALISSIDRPDILNLLVAGYSHFSSAAICAALNNRLSCDSDELKDGAVCKIVENICAIPTELDRDDLSPILESIIFGSIEKKSSLDSIILRSKRKESTVLSKSLVKVLNSRIPEELRVSIIKQCVLQGLDEMCKILSSHSFSEKGRGELILWMLNYYDKVDALSIVRTLLETGRISTEDRGAAILVATRNYPYLESVVAYLMSDLFPVEAMKGVVRAVVKWKHELAPLSELLEDDLLNKIDGQFSEQEFWKEAFLAAAYFGRSQLIKELVEKEKYAFPVIEEGILTVCSTDGTRIRSDTMELEILMFLLENLPPEGKLSGAVLSAAVGRTYFFSALVEHRKKNPDKWNPLEGMRGEIFNKAIGSGPISQRQDWTVESGLSLQIFLREEGAHISLQERGSALARLTENDQLDKLKIVLSDTTERTLARSSDDWDTVLGPALQQATSQSSGAMILKPLLERGEISSKMKRTLYLRARDPAIFAELKNKNPIYAGKLDMMKTFCVEIWIRFAFFLRSLCAWRS